MIERELALTIAVVFGLLVVFGIVATVRRHRGRFCKQCGCEGYESPACQGVYSCECGNEWRVK